MAGTVCSRIVSLCWLLVCAFAVAAEEPPKTSVLHWTNGDSLEGVVHSATEEELTWDSPLFDSALRLRLDQLHSVTFPIRKRIPDEVPTQIIETTDGNRLYGNVTEINDQFVSIQTKLFGSIKLRRAAVHLLSSPIQRAHVYSGPKGLSGWSTRTYGRKLAEWDVISGGGLSTSTVAAELYRPLDASGLIDIDMDIQWRKNPSFQICFLTPFAATTKETVKLETRAGGYVLQTLSSSGRFQQVEELSKRSTQCRLLLRWDQSTQKLTIYRDKKYVGQMEVAGNRKPGIAGLYIKNTGPQLTLSRLEINGGSTLRTRSVDPTTDFVQLADDKSVVGQIEGMEKNAAAITIRDANGTESNLPWSEIAEVSFRTAAVDRAVKQDKLVECLFHNGEVIRGEFSLADAGGVTLKIPAADRPVRCPLTALERITFNNVFESAPGNAAQIRVGRATLHGQLVGCEPDQAIGWLPVGGVQACRLTSAKPARVILEHRRSQPIGVVDEDLMYLRSGDLIPCFVESVDEQYVTLATRLAGKCKVAIDTLKAIELAAAPLESTIGFDDPGWKSNSVNNITHDQRKVTFKGPATWRNENCLKGDQIEFDLNWSPKQTGVSVQVYLLGGNRLRHQAIRLYCIKNQFVFAGLGNRRFQQAGVLNQPLRFRISREGAVQLTINGKEIHRLQTHDAEGWTGIEFKVARYGAGAGVRVRGPDLRPQFADLNAPEVTISNFGISKSNVRSGSLALALQDAGPLLTIPRSRRHNPAQHLLVGINDDLVRGNLLFLDKTTLRFRSRLDEMSFARDAVAGVIWLENEEPKPVPAPPHPRIVLQNGSTISVTSNRIEDGVIAGVHPEIGNCRLPLAEIREILIGEVNNPPQAHSYSGWRMRPAPEPRFAEGAAGDSGSHSIDSPLVGEVVKDFLASLLDDGRSFQLNHHRGQVVVLDFWATWCAPCVRSMSGLIDTVDAFPADQVRLIAINQQEDDETVRAFREAHGWQLSIGLDPLGQIGQQFGVESIPQTVVIDQEGKVAQMFVGASPDLHAEIRATIEQLLQTP